jgi:amino acid adenylation domain-containing protein
MLNSAVKLLDQAALKYGDRCAVEDEHGTLTYTEYRRVSRCVGSGLLAAGAARRPVIVYLPKSVKALTVFMGAQYCGCPYAPVDAHIPMTRLTKIVESLQPGAIITDESLAQNLSECDLGDTKVCLCSDLEQTEDAGEALDRILDTVIDLDPIYIMYTSGSTGVPKGVTIPHRGIIDYAAWVVSTFGFTEETVMASQSAFYFDNSTFDIYGCLQCGGHLVLIPENLILFPTKLPQFLREKHITSIFWVPTVMISVANSGVLDSISLPELKNVAFCGEVMPNRQLNIWRKALPNCTYANLYGPTEITDVCCYYRVDREFADNEPLPIGKACENMRVLILKEDGSQAGPNEQGELCVLGSGVALGYWNAPEITSKAFTANPLNPNWYERMYHTGDLAYVNDAGEIIFLGRRDSQIKLRGNRIELGDIEAAARSIDHVENACALFDREEEKIVLFLETKEQFILRKFNLELRNFLPKYMLPGKLICLEAFPMNANRKVDRLQLGGMIK